MLSLAIGFSIGNVFPRMSYEPAKVDLKPNYGILDVHNMKHLGIMKANLEVISGEFLVNFRAVDSTLYVIENPLGQFLKDRSTMNDSIEARYVKLIAK